MTRPSLSDGAREALLERGAATAASDWAASCFVALEREGRALEGGWPGTVSEARVLAHASVGKLLVERSLPAMTHDELGRMARRTYDEARRAWQAATKPSKRRARLRQPAT